MNKESIRDYIEQSEAKEMIDRLIRNIENKIDRYNTHHWLRKITLFSHPMSAETPPATDGEYTINIKDGEDTLATFANDNQSNVMAESVNYLIIEHDLISKIVPLPYIPGREKTILNDEPTSPHDEQAMRTFRGLDRGYYLDTHMDEKTKKRHTWRIADKCALDVEFRGNW